MAAGDGGIFSFNIVAAVAAPDGSIVLLDGNGSLFGTTEQLPVTFQQFRSLATDRAGRIWAASAGWVPAPSTIYGSIKDAPVPSDGGTFTLSPAPFCLTLTGPVGRTVSTMDGVYSFKDLPAGYYGLTANDCGAGNFIDQYQTVTVTGGSTQERNFELVAGTVGADVSTSIGTSGGTASTGAVPTALTPTVATVTIPAGGTDTTLVIRELTAAEAGAAAPPSGFSVVGQPLLIDAPGAIGTPSDPLVITLVFDSTALGGTDYRSLQVIRDGAVIADCATALASLPCVSSREARPGGDAAVTIFTDHFSLWAGASIPANAAGACLLSQSLLPTAIAKSLCMKLGSPSASDMPAQRNSLKAFANAVRAQRGKTITSGLADTLLRFVSVT